MAWVQTKGMAFHRSQVNARFPNRDKTSDGTIGDQAHAEGTSGHNPESSGHAEYDDHDGIDEVRAWDMDSDLRDSYGVTAEGFVQWLVMLGRSGRYLPFRYFIYNGRIWRKATGWLTEVYTGASKHTEHIHFSGDYTQTADNYTTPLGILTLGIPLEDDVQQADIDEIVAKTLAAVNTSATADNGAIQYGIRKALTAYIDDFGNWGPWQAFRAQTGDSLEAQNAALNAYQAAVTQMQSDVNAMRAQLNVFVANQPPTPASATKAK